MKNLLILFIFLNACGYKNTKMDSSARGFGGGEYAKGNNGTNTSSLDYAIVRANVLEHHCFECHSNDGGNEGDVNMETYANTFNAINKIKNEVTAGKMPKRRPPLPPEAKQMLLDWINAGAPEFAANNPGSETGPQQPGQPNSKPDPNQPGSPPAPNPNPCESEHEDDHGNYNRNHDQINSEFEISRHGGDDDCKTNNLPPSIN